MPYKTHKEKGGGYTTTSPHGVKGRHMTKGNMEAQLRLLRGIEHNPEFAKQVRSRSRAKGTAKPRK
jgi:hypothetical protein